MPTRSWSLVAGLKRVVVRNPSVSLSRTPNDLMGRMWPADTSGKMDDFRRELTAAIEALIAEGRTPMFLVADLVGAEPLRRAPGGDALEAFRETCMATLSAAASNAETFSYGDLRIVAMLHGYDRLKTFALVDKMRRMLPLLAQSFDCMLVPEFDTIEYEEPSGVAGIINQLVAPRLSAEAA